MSQIDEAVKEFLIESHENLGQLDVDLVALEKDPTATGTIAGIFRAVHTVKGSAGFLGYSKLEAVAHAGEGLLGRLRDGSLAADSEIIGALLSMLDAVREMLASVEAAGHDGGGEYSELIERLTRLRESAVAAQAGRSGSLATGRAASHAAAGIAQAANSTPATAAPRVATPAGEKPFVSKTKPGSSVVTPRSPGSSTVVPNLPLTSGSEPSRTLSPAAKDSAALPAPVSDSRIRIDIKVLDKLVNLVSELVLARNQIQQNIAAESDTALVNAGRQLNLITSELQEEVMRTRMQPIGNVWNTLPRVVRDLGVACGKQVRIELEGGETELDKTILESIKDPLTHMVRNAIDHGIEFPGARAASGKPAEGRILLRAFHEGGLVNIEISDDGAGIDPERVARKAIDRGLVTPEQVALMGEQTVTGLIFLPGFSTAERVTNLSGRGVGMDVVKINVERIGGIVDVQSKLGAGTTIRVRIPLTLAIIKALIVTCGSEQYAIPQNSMVELVRLEGDRARRGIEPLHGAPVYRFRGKLVPIVYLRRMLGLDDGRDGLPGSGGAATAPRDDVTNIIVLHVDGRHFGLVVDRINDTQEIVVKPLARQLRGLSCFAGATIMGNGTVSLILDVLGLADSAHLLPTVRESALPEAELPAVDESQDRQAVVVVETTDHGRAAIPLSSVARLEEIPRSRIERVHDQELVQYRGQILPLINVAAFLAARRDRPQPAATEPTDPADRTNGSVHVVVCSDGERSVGLVVDRIIDIAEESLAVRGPAGRDSVLFTAVIQDHVTELLDVGQFIARSNPCESAALVAAAAEA